jgi:hypothetical protein
MDNIPNRLRSSTEWFHTDCELKQEAASHIEALEAQLAEDKQREQDFALKMGRLEARAEAAEQALAAARAFIQHVADGDSKDYTDNYQRAEAILASLAHPASAPTPEAVAGWQPIETAQSEHLIFYGNTRHDTCTVFTGWKAQNGRYYADNGDSVKPTHWMPLPAPPSDPATTPAPTPSLDDLVKFALGHAVGLCSPHEDDDDTARKARQECADAIAFASIAPDTIAAIIKTAGGRENE